jgi:hypothetical protein
MARRYWPDASSTDLTVGRGMPGVSPSRLDTLRGRFRRERASEQAALGTANAGQWAIEEYVFDVLSWVLTEIASWRRHRPEAKQDGVEAGAVEAEPSTQNSNRAGVRQDVLSDAVRCPEDLVPRAVF